MFRRPTSVQGSGREVNVIGPSITLYYEVGREESLLASEQSEIHSGNGTRGAAISGRKPNLPLSSRSASSARAAAPVVVKGGGRVSYHVTIAEPNPPSLVATSVRLRFRLLPTPRGPPSRATGP